MSATLLFYSSFTVTINGVTHEGGDRLNPILISVSDSCLDLTKAMATGTTWDVWTVGAEEPISSFDFLWIESDYDVFLELTIDEGGSVGQEEIAIEIKAGVPFCLGSDVGKALYAADFATGTDDLIERIRIRNESGSTATVRIFMAT